MQIYLQYGDEMSNHQEKVLMSYLNMPPNAVKLPDRTPSVLDAHFKFEDLNVIVKFVPCDYEQVLNSFTLEPCKICYHYETNRMFLSSWFVMGGRAAIFQYHSALAERYKYKNVMEYSLPVIKSDTFYNLNYVQDVEDRILSFQDLEDTFEEEH
jgi:hypothetical protein